MGTLTNPDFTVDFENVGLIQTLNYKNKCLNIRNTTISVGTTTNHDLTNKF
ncbi:hypothetical protein LEP1GSC013_0241 [Leptospira interrogans serovar Valbuzzi str. Duyster]|nr:hypothetical protein LEP1GSC013_0241 [Leptospira interrogans serovar Valbuzzi str. Duyster]